MAPAVTGEHDVTIETSPQSLMMRNIYRWWCTCGAAGEWRPDKRDAETEGRAHDGCGGMTVDWMWPWMASSGRSRARCAMRG